MLKIAFNGKLILAVAAALLAASVARATSDPITPLVQACSAVPGTSGCELGNCPPPSGCKLSECKNGYAAWNNAMILSTCDMYVYGSQTWNICIEQSFSWAWIGEVMGAGAWLGSVGPNRDCRNYAKLVKGIQADIDEQWACLWQPLGKYQNSLKNGLGTIISQDDASLPETAQNCTPPPRNHPPQGSSSSSSSGGGSSSSSSGGTLEFGSSSSSGGGGSGASSSSSSGGGFRTNISNGQAIQVIGFDTGNATLNEELAAGVSGPLPAGSQAQEDFRARCAGNAQCFFKSIAPNSEAAFDLGLGGAEPQNTSETVYGKTYRFCNGNWVLNSPPCFGRGRR